MWHIEELKPRVGSSSRSPGWLISIKDGKEPSWFYNTSSGILVNLDPSSETHRPVSVCLPRSLVPSSSLAFLVHHSAGALPAPSSLSSEPQVWRFNQQRVLGDKVENKMTDPLPDHLSLTLEPDPLLVNPLGQNQSPSGDHPRRQTPTKDGTRRGCPRKWEHKSFLVYLLAQYVIG